VSPARFSLALALLLGLSTGAANAQSGSIAGTVVERESGHAVAGAVVTIEGTDRTATSNAVGRFRFDGASPEPVVLVVRAGGFLDRRVPGVQPTTGAGPTIELDVTPNFMDRVQVTATKTPQSVGDVAAPTDIVDRSTIESRGDQTLVQAINHVPGVVVSTQLGLFESVMLRGMPRGDPEFTNTLLLIDGVPQTNSNNGARVVALPINDASSIEVMRGPNSALYGRTAIGGAINVRTAQPTPDIQAGVDLTAGELDMLKGVARVSGPLRQWGGYYASAAKERNHGYFDNRTTSDFSVGNEALFGKLTFAPNRRSSGSISVNRVTSDNSTPTNEPIVGGRLLHEIDPRFNRLANFNIPGPNYHQSETRVTLNYAQELAPWARAVNVFGYRAVQHKFINDGDFIGSPYDLDAHTFTMYPFSQQLDEDIFFEELRFELTPKLGAMKSALTAGGSYEWNNGDLASDFIFTDADLGGWTMDYLNPVIPPESQWEHDTGTRKYRLGVGALFAQYMVEPAPRLVLTAGGRYDRLDLRNARNGGSNTEATFDAFSPKASATVRLLGLEGGGNPTLNAYAAYSHAFLPPRRPSSLVPADVPLKLEPEDIDNYEGGLKGSLLDGRLSLEASYFWMKENGVVLSTRQGPFFLPTNAGEQRYKGVETGATMAVSPRFSMYLNASFYRNRFGHFVIESEDGDEVLTGNRLPISPDHVVNWGVHVAPSVELDATLNVKHVGEVQTNRENTFTLDGYNVVDAAISWTRGPLRLTLSGHNLLDESYYGNSDGDTADPGRPRQVLLTTSLLFK
jgi:outer membrane receptor protein involved in Fe transport